MDDNALTVLLDRHGDLAWSLALHATGDESLAEQVVGQTWANASRLAHRRDRTLAERWWVLRLVYLECERVARRASPLAAVVPARREPLEVLVQGLQALPVRRRAAWVMHELMDMRAIEVAAVLTTSEWQAQALVAEARKALMAHFVRQERRTAQRRLVASAPA